MDLVYSKKSKGTLEDLQKKYQEDWEREREEKRLKRLEYDRTHGFKSLDEILTYLKNGGVIGTYEGVWGEKDMTNDFLVWKNGEIVRRFQNSSGDDCHFWMETSVWDMEKFKDWLILMETHKNEEGYYNTHLLHKNFDITIDDIDSRLI